MSEHFNKQTVEATVWCNKCGTNTPHSIFGGRRGACLTCLKRLNDAPKVEPPAEQKGLF